MTEIHKINYENGLLKFSDYRLTGIKEDVIIKIKGEKGSAYMSFLGIIDCESKETKGSNEKVTLNEKDREIGLLNSIVRNELQISGLKGRTGKVQLEIYDVQGRRVMYKGIGASEHEILSISHTLPNGVYILRLKDDKEDYTTKFTVIR